MVSALAARKQAVFKSVFQTEISQPTPYSTPSVRFAEEGQPWGVLPAALHISNPRQRHGRQDSGDLSGPAEDQVRWDRAWHTVTSHIQLPPSVAAEDSFGQLGRASQDAEEGFSEALKVVLYPEESTPRAKHTEDILLWHTQQVRHHFIQHALPLLSACGGNAGHAQVLLGSMQTLEAAHRQYLYGLQVLLRGMREGDSDLAMEKFRHDLHAVIGNSMSPSLLSALKAVLRHNIRRCLGVPSEDEVPTEDEMAASRLELVSMVDSLSKVGLAGERFQVLFAELMDDAMGEFIVRSYAGRWSFEKYRATDGTQSSDASGGSYCTDRLRNWVENHFSRLVVEVLGRLGEEQVPWSEVAKWKETALGRLAVLRIHELYDIVLSWPHSREGLDDLRVTITTPQRRLQLTDAFSEALRRRLLHPGCSTLKILRVYISMIRTFHALDHSKVLLDRVVHSLQLYLRQRNDAIRIVVTGLLANYSKEEEELAKGKLVELSRLLDDPSQDRRTNFEDEELDWDDMDWVPVPVDAAVNYKRPKSEDVVGTLIGALGSQDIFIKEFQGVIAERLLSQDPPFAQEMAVLGLLKKRFGENELQNCDVMLKDIGDSKRVDDTIAVWMRSGEAGPLVAPSMPALEVHAKILSRLFWPTLPREHFVVPRPVVEWQRRYESGFEHLKSQRKLTWIDNVGTATVELALEDREVKVECKTYHAAVIYAFGEDEDGAGGEGPPGSPVRKTAVELEEQLQMDEDLVGEALSFWVSQRVLREDPRGTFTVMETLAPSASRDASSPAAAEAAAAGPSTPARRPGRAIDAKEVQQRQVYWQFIKGMLTNSAAVMPAGQIGMMLKMLLPDGFPWGEEELVEFLGEKVEEGELEFVGVKYKLVKR
ncbi:related to component of the anaphase promoting complex [Cephalotrichum gorgonifer]|uniref:Anaphase-promoting complex subunit 2 n=1 Tax=Cephalotrichum gorgonifer TaxID=2041049 RepID=A0AAE8MX24_9PEZI|nr:related to component of the anaphase promoting complex [Cephalotrichum gorgonifer]